MTKAFLSSSVRAGYWYLFFLVSVFSLAFYGFTGGDPSRKDQLYKQAFYLTGKAFENGIYFAHVKYMSNPTAVVHWDRWRQRGLGLDYNAYGYPIGTDIDDASQTQPETVENCRQIWQFVLGPLQPKLFLQPSDNGYWAELNSDKICVYRPFLYKKLEIRYISSNGRVNLIK